MYRVLAWGAFTLGVVPYIANPVLRFAAKSFEGLDVAVLLGSFAAVLILFSVPVTLLGTISPFAIRLSVDDPKTSGVTAGTIYGISTLGSFIGTFLPVLVTIPTIGTRNTFLVFSLLLLFVALAGLGKFGSRKLMLQNLWMPVALVVLALFTAGQSLKNSTGQIYETEVGIQLYSGAAGRTAIRCCGSTTAKASIPIYNPDTFELRRTLGTVPGGAVFLLRARARADVKRMAIVGTGGRHGCAAGDSGLWSHPDRWI